MSREETTDMFLPSFCLKVLGPESATFPVPVYCVVLVIVLVIVLVVVVVVKKNILPLMLMHICSLRYIPRHTFFLF